jgi:type IV secretion system protein VirD4
VRVAFATNDERTAKRVSDALGTATEMRAMKNYAGHRLSPWLGHLMVSRQETARPLLTPGEVMQLPPADELVLVSGVHPIRAKKARYFEDERFVERVLPPPEDPTQSGKKIPHDDWTALPPQAPPEAFAAAKEAEEDIANGGIRREPELPEHEAMVKENPDPSREFAVVEDKPDDTARRAQVLRQRVRVVARQASMDPGAGIEL